MPEQLAIIPTQPQQSAKEAVIRGPCERDELTGLKASADVSASKAEARAAGCTVFSVNTIGFLLGYSTKSRQAAAYVDRVAIPCAIRGGAHFVELLDDAGVHRGWASATNSLCGGGGSQGKDAATVLRERVAAIHRGEIMTDVSGGTSIR